ncbi:uncharacterized protein LOC130994476 [Salvia miltiorrhiza]|uniref:uncharacterized protein LOC130994476 n=1 Tax=Salvia miltiorrhiza TaxID=226208 RepID=UPI0025AC7F43|nr:uncharacterized protein LOC130994476 [Salvia miltiorrhiza]
MVDFGEDFIIESYKIPWLIWIQLLITILLVFCLFFGFAAFTYDASTSSAAAAPSVGGDAAPNNSTSPNGLITVEDERAGGDAGSSGGSSREEDELSLKDTVFLSIFQHPSHPCNYFGMAKQALFKCFGLDSSSESSISQQHEKRD